MVGVLFPHENVEIVFDEDNQIQLSPIYHEKVAEMVKRLDKDNTIRLD